MVELLFDPSALKQYFIGRQKNLREIFQLGEGRGIPNLKGENPVTASTACIYCTVCLSKVDSVVLVS